MISIIVFKKLNFINDIPLVQIMNPERPLDALNEARNKRVIVELKNGKQLIGTLRAFDII
jgi:hypothetical protein